MKFAIKPIWHYPPHLRHVVTLPWETKNSNFLQILKKKRTDRRSPRTEENAKLLQKFPQFATDFVLPIFRWSDREHLFVRKENKVSGILRELLKQKLSGLYASSAVRVCQLLCMAPLEIFQIQVLTNNLGHRRPMNTHLPWYLTDSPVGLWLVLLSQD